MRRHVKIDLVSNDDDEFYVVRYDRRSKWQKHWAAQFNVKSSTRADVVAWVKRHPNLTLKETEDDPA
jgi:hypothetical protein